LFRTSKSSIFEGMKEEVYAVITGDLVDSTIISEGYTEVLENLAEDIKNHVDDGFLFDIFRGDSFQGLIVQPANALKITTLFRAGLRRNAVGKSVDSIWDARISIGIGNIKNNGKISEMKLGSAVGEAFTRSGRALDYMKTEELQLTIHTGDQSLDNEFSAVCPLLNAIIGRWTTSQAEAVYLQLLEGITQEEIGSRLGISQRASGKRLESSNFDKMKKYLDRFSNLIQWKYFK